jgi:cysteinyl-tRNA synthetase
MTIRVYNTLSRKKEIFEPIEPGRVRMYVCGPTVYDSSHIGHARSVVVFDVIARYMRSQGYDVTYVRNFTDIDDKIINRASELSTDWETLSEKYIQEFHTDMDSLHVDRADIEPKATAHIDHMIKVIETLITKGHAYDVDGDVFFSVDSFEGYGKLSGRKLEDMEAGARVDIDQRKKNPFDFALWKSSKPGEPAWDSPWGKGRPGWHIECSAMSSEYLGQTIDIHGGGKDLIFPHHENEIAQSEAAFGHTFVKYWIHNGFVNIDQEKMSKSLGNFLLIRDVLKNYDRESIRLFLLSKQYRSPIDFSEKAMAECNTGLEKIYGLLDRVEKEIGPDSGPVETGAYWKRFCEAMDDDFNTAKGLGILFEAVRNMNRLLDEKKDPLTGEIRKDIDSARNDILEMGKILGILAEPPVDYFEKRKSAGIRKESVDPSEVEKLIQAREDARASRDWETADRIRNQLDEWNIVLEDRSDGTIWKFSSEKK